MIDVVALGELLIDFATVGLSEDGYPCLQAQPGGAPANVAAAAAFCGSSASFLGKVGDDVFGRLLLSTLGTCGVGCEGVVADPDAFTTLAFVTLDEKGERSFGFARKPGADTRLRADEIAYSLIEEARIFHFGSLSLTDEPARTATRQAVYAAHAHGCLASFDPNYRESLWQDERCAREAIEWGMQQSNIIKMSAEEAVYLLRATPHEAARRLLELEKCQLAIITLGAKGAYAATPFAEAEVPASPTARVRDTTGAGDIFLGALLSRLAAPYALGKGAQELSRDELSAMVGFACEIASRSTGYPGGISALLRMREA